MDYPQFSSESVCEGHPDKVCDQISDAILDACYTLDPKARVGVETLVTTNKIVLAGEITVNGKIDFEAIARQKIAELDYLDPVLNFTNKSDVEVYIHQQPPCDIDFLLPFKYKKWTVIYYDRFFIKLARGRRGV